MKTLTIRWECGQIVRSLKKKVESSKEESFKLEKEGKKLERRSWKLDEKVQSWIKDLPNDPGNDQFKLRVRFLKQFADKSIHLSEERKDVYKKLYTDFDDALLKQFKESPGANNDVLAVVDQMESNLDLMDSKAYRQTQGKSWTNIMTTTLRDKERSWEKQHNTLIETLRDKEISWEKQHKTLSETKSSNPFSQELVDSKTKANPFSQDNWDPKTKAEWNKLLPSKIVYCEESIHGCKLHNNHNLLKHDLKVLFNRMK